MICGRGETGRRKGLKIPRPQGCAGSTPAVRTSRRLDLSAGLLRTALMNTQRIPQRLTTPKPLIEAGLAGPERLPELEPVTRRYAIGLTPALAALVRPED